jgi:hypothetical protein
MENTKFWKLWARALGEKVGEDNRRADRVAWIRTFIVLQAVICNIFIVINILLSWFSE